MSEQTNDYKIEFKDGYSLIIDATENYVSFQFNNKDDKPIKTLQSKGDPTSLTPRSAIGSEIKRHLKDKLLSDEGNILKYEETMIEISSMVDEILVAKNEAHQMKGKAELEIEEDRIEEGARSLEEMEVPPLVWIANLIDWYTAGERMNILYAFITYCSQIILDTPISVIGIGETNSGKTHIEEVALSLLPQQYVLEVKTLSEPALYAYSKINPYYFDQMIINIGDMGGTKDHEEAEKFKNAIKELQTDGKIKRIIQVKDDSGNWTPQEFVLLGFPCLTYTTVPGYDFDGQELSRSVMFEPRNDNNKAVSIFTSLNDIESGPTAKNIQERRDKIPLIQNMVLSLKHRVKDVKIWNPYNSFMDKFLGESKYFKRDIKKYTGILKVITALNGYNRKQINDTILTTKEDIYFFLDLLSSYQEAIVTNLSPPAVNVLNELRNHAEEWELYDDGITVNDFEHDCNKLDFAKSSLRRYFSELNSAGLIKVVDREGQSNVYVLLLDDYSEFKGEIELDEVDLKMLKYNFDIDKLDESDTSYISPEYKLESVKEPVWNDYLPENQSIGDNIT